MRHVLVDHARAKQTAKRGGGWDRVTLSDVGTDADGAIDVLALEDALARLAALNPRDAQLVELRFFGGLTSEEAGAVLGISRTEVARRWRIAKAWLADELDDTGSAG